MKRFVSVLLLLMFLVATPAHADWRWAKPHFKPGKIAYFCDTMQCIKASKAKAREQRHRKMVRYNHRKQHEWSRWTTRYIPDCTWYGESGSGPEYDRPRYLIWNSQGSGARGKYQFMSGTYHDVAKYHDWSALDQEIAGHREFEKNGTGPWANC